MLSPFFCCQAQSLFMKRSSVLQSVFDLRKPLSKKQERSFTRSATSLDMEKFSLASKYKGIHMYLCSIFNVQRRSILDMYATVHPVSTIRNPL